MSDTIKSTVMDVDAYIDHMLENGYQIWTVALDGYTEPLIVELDTRNRVDFCQPVVDALRDHIKGDLTTQDPKINWWITTDHGSDTLVDYSMGDHGLGMVCADVGVLEDRDAFTCISAMYPTKMPFGVEPYPSGEELMDALASEVEKLMQSKSATIHHVDDIIIQNDLDVLVRDVVNLAIAHPRPMTLHDRLTAVEGVLHMLSDRTLAWLEWRVVGVDFERPQCSEHWRDWQDLAESIKAELQKRKR